MALSTANTGRMKQDCASRRIARLIDLNRKLFNRSAEQVAFKLLLGKSGWHFAEHRNDGNQEQRGLSQKHGFNG